MNETSFRVDRAHAALLQRRSHLQNILAAKDRTALFRQHEGFAFLLRGPERVRVEDELRHVEFVTALLTAGDWRTEQPPSSQHH